MNNGLIFRIQNRQKEEQANSTNPSQTSLHPPAGGEDHPQQGDQANEAMRPTDSGVKEIILKAPIGHAFTEALQHLLCKDNNRTGVIRSENNMTQMVAGGLSEVQEEELTPAEANRAYIFVNDGRRMSLGEVDALVNYALDTQKKNPHAGYMAVVLDGMDEVAANEPTKGEFMALQALHLESHGVNVIYTRTRLLSTMENWLGVR